MTWPSGEFRAHRDSFDKALRPASASFAPYQALDILREKLPADGILAYDVGAHTHQIASQWRTDQPRTLLATNGWSSMGYGMPAAYAAKLVHPDRAVVGVIGDGCFQMTAGELALARRRNLAVPVIVLNDGWLGLMKVKQEKRNYPLSGVHLGAPPESPAHYFGVPCRAAKSPRSFARRSTGHWLSADPASSKRSSMPKAIPPPSSINSPSIHMPADSSVKRHPGSLAILALISASHIVGASAQYGISTLAPFYQDELDLSRAQVGLFISAFYLAMTGASFGAGWLADRMGVGKTTLQGHLSVGVCIGATALAPTFDLGFRGLFSLPVSAMRFSIRLRPKA